MKDKTELINILKAELTLLAQEIIKDIHKKDIKDIYKSSRKLYEKTNAVYQLSKLMDAEELEEILANYPEETDKTNKVSGNSEGYNKNIKEGKPADKYTYKKPEKKGNFSSKGIYKSVSNMKFVPKENAEKKVAVKAANGEGKKMNIGLNDKIAFIRHLFNNDSTTYNKVIEKLNEIDSYEEALVYLNNEVKPRFNHWEDKDEYEFRLIQLLELKFN